MIPHRPIEHITKYISGFLCDLCTYVVITKNKKRKVKTPHRHIEHITKFKSGFLCDLCTYVVNF